jgi:hypothetical protein
MKNTAGRGQMTELSRALFRSNSASRQQLIPQKNADETLKNNSTLHFERFEFKYILSAQKRRELEADLLYFLDYDPFVSNIKTHKYHVRSLYFDDAIYSAFHDKEDGLHSRSKFRLRTYACDFSDHAPVFPEIKGRHNNLVFKHRTPIDTNGSDWSVFKGSILSREVLARAAPSTVRDQFEYELYRKTVRPITLIDYERRPYVSKYDPGFRVTFDERLGATRANCLYPDRLQGEKRVLPGYTVLEIKFFHQIPSWFHRVIQTHQLNRRAISKICEGMKSLDMVADNF